MTTRILVLLTAFCLAAQAADNPPTESSVKQLLEVTKVRELIDTTMSQMDGMLKQMMAQATQGQPVSPEVQKEIDKGHTEAMNMMKELLDWNKLEPMYVRIYQKSFTQGEIDGLIAMYKTPAGQTLLTKMPVMMQDTMTEMQQLMQPVIQRMQQKQQEIAAKVRAQKGKSGS